MNLKILYMEVQNRESVTTRIILSMPTNLGYPIKFHLANVKIMSQAKGYTKKMREKIINGIASQSPFLAWFFFNENFFFPIPRPLLFITI